MRQVMPLAIVTDEQRRSTSSTYLQARCSIAKAVRTFRVDRIESLSDAKTGEVLNVADWVAALPLGDGAQFTWADDAEKEIPPAASTSVRRLAWRAILIALFIGYAVGRLRIASMILRHFHAHHGLWL